MRSKAPAVRSAGLLRTPVDAFIEARLEEAGLTLGPEAPRDVLLRRLSFDLRGLPPDPEESRAYAEDRRPDAYERLADRFLADPAYGERWAKYWLDAAGYADSNGYFHADTDRPLAYKYRDWVIRAFSRDMPFDRFLREQIAGDEIAGWRPGDDVDPATAELLIATHFVRNAPDGTGESDGNPLERRIDKLRVLEGIVEILGESILALTLRCARCHDHKFEPITQRDYYALQAIFQPAYLPEAWLKPNERYAEIGTRAEREATETPKRKTPPPPERIACVYDVRPDPPPHRILERGDYRRPGPPVEPGVPEAIRVPGFEYRPDPGAAARGSSGRRLALARWLTSPDHPLVARVFVNRVWYRRFGRGIVETVGNLGRSGAKPTHPLLLDTLARGFVEGGWSVKRLQRLLVTSHVFRQTDGARPGPRTADPENRLWWRFPLRRLDAEALRDAILAVAGLLDRTPFGPYVPSVRRSDGQVVPDPGHPGARRRSVYLQVRRTQMTTFLELFDAPAITLCAPMRAESNVPLQSLALLNSDFVRRAARAFARRIIEEGGESAADRLAYACRLAWGRDPLPRERAALLGFLREEREALEARTGSDAAPEAAAGPGGGCDLARLWCEVAHLILSSNAFLYVE